MRFPAFLAALALVAAILGQAAVAAAQTLDGLPIRSIEYRGLESLPQDSLDFYLGIQVGEAYDSLALNESIHQLWNRGLIENIEVDAQPADDGVALVIVVEERPVLRSIEYQGIKRLTRTDINEEISRKRLKVREGEPLNRGELRRLQRLIEELYAEKGFRLADASYRVEPIDKDRRVIFTIDEGDKVRIEDIDFEGNTVFSDRRLRYSMKKTKESGFISKLRKKDIYKEPTLAEDLDSVRSIYRQAGYKNVVLGEPKVEIRAKNPNAPTLKQQNRRLYLTIPVEEGARWKLGEITVEGNSKIADEILLRQFEKPRGGWLRSNVIDEGAETITELYKNSGHLFVLVEPRLIERENQVADVLVQIEEGDQYRIGRIEFEGNRRTRDKVLRRELGIQESLVLNSGALRNSLLRIGQLEFFKVNEDDPVAFEFDNDEKLVDLNIKGAEGDRTELLFGAGFSEIDGFFGQFSFRSRNFLGRGETLGVSVQSGRRQDVFDISYLIPWFLGRPQSAGIQLFVRDLDFQLLPGQRLEQKTEGVTLTYGRRLGLFSNISFSVSRFSSLDRRPIQLVDGSIVTQEFDRDVSSLQIQWIRDRRDSRLQPTVGTRYSSSIEFAGGPLGGSTDFVRQRANFTMYRPITKTGLRTVAAVNFEGGIIEPLRGSDLFFFDRFYLGGENSVRGFRFRSIWARDKAGNTILDQFGVPIGGDRFFRGNFEGIILMGGPFRLIGFFDAGGVWVAEQELTFDTMRLSTGLELQVNVPLFGAPLRFIYSQNVDPFPDDRFESFQFSIGPSF